MAKLNIVLYHVVDNADNVNKSSLEMYTKGPEQPVNYDPDVESLL